MDYIKFLVFCFFVYDQMQAITTLKNIPTEERVFPYHHNPKTKTCTDIQYVSKETALLSAECSHLHNKYPIVCWMLPQQEYPTIC